MAIAKGKDEEKSAVVEFVCRDCKEGKHDCQGRWEGQGLEIRCSCKCLRMMSK